MSGEAADPGEIEQALAELRALTACGCPADYTDRGRHAVICAHDYRDDVEVLARALGMEVHR